jgi:hypothetical protein
MSVVVGDFDGDGKADVIATTSDGGNFFVFHGNGDGTVAPPKAFAGRFLNGYQVNAALDVNGDGKLDLVVSVINGARVEVFLGMAMERFKRNRHCREHTTILPS